MNNHDIWIEKRTSHTSNTRLPTSKQHTNTNRNTTKRKPTTKDRTTKEKRRNKMIPTYVTQYIDQLNNHEKIKLIKHIHDSLKNPEEGQT